VRPTTPVAAALTAVADDVDDHAQVAAGRRAGSMEVEAGG
jgi:hypothetical protein